MGPEPRCRWYRGACGCRCQTNTGASGLWDPLGRVGLRVVDEDAGPPEDVPDVAVWALVAGVPYVRGWAEADEAARLLRAELDALGVGDRVGVRARVSAGGQGVVELGWVSPELAELLAAVLAQERARQTTAGPVSGPAPRAA